MTELSAPAWRVLRFCARYESWHTILELCHIRLLEPDDALAVPGLIAQGLLTRHKTLEAVMISPAGSVFVLAQPSSEPAFKVGDVVRIGLDERVKGPPWGVDPSSWHTVRRSVDAKVVLASENAMSLAVTFEAELDGHVGMMALLRDSRGDYRSVTTDQIVTINPRVRDV